MDSVSASQKVCVSCGKDVSNAKRFKDLAAHYYCEECWTEHTAQERRAKEAAAEKRKATAESQPASAVDAPVLTDPLLAALAGVPMAAPRQTAGDQPEALPTPTPRPPRRKGPGVWLLWTLILLGVTLLGACIIVLILIFHTTEKPADNSTSTATSVSMVTLA